MLHLAEWGMVFISDIDCVAIEYQAFSFRLKVVMQCIGKPGGEAVYPGPDNNQVFFVTVREDSPIYTVLCACMASAMAPKTPACLPSLGGTM
jgi:hypothetical protein